jgi:hypothetical protein
MLLGARGEIPEDARIVTGDAGRSLLARCLTGQPRPAKLNGVAIDDDVADPAGVDEVATRIALVVIEPSEPDRAEGLIR